MKSLNILTNHITMKRNDSKQNEDSSRETEYKGEKAIIVRDATTREERWAGRAQNRS